MAKKSASDESVEVPDYLKGQVDWDQTQGEDYGGSSEILYIEEGEVVGPLTFVAARPNVDLGNAMGTVTMYEAKDSQNAVWRLPIAANFRRQAEAANLQRGDTFAVKRLEDQVKKHGKGKGNPMEMYAIKVLKRAPQGPTV